jgi:hypothetical protein
VEEFEAYLVENGYFGWVISWRRVILFIGG